jgi:hypothetical protein
MKEKQPENRICHKIGEKKIDNIKGQRIWQQR